MSFVLNLYSLQGTLPATKVMCSITLRQIVAMLLLRQVYLKFIATQRRLHSLQVGKCFDLELNCEKAEKSWVQVCLNPDF